MAHKDNSNDDEHQKRQALGNQPLWRLNRLSATGRHFLLEPESRTGIVQELQLRLLQEQRRRRELLQLRSGNNVQHQRPPALEHDAEDESDDPDLAPAPSSSESKPLSAPSQQQEAAPAADNDNASSRRFGGAEEAKALSWKSSTRIRNVDAIDVDAIDANQEGPADSLEGSEISSPPLNVTMEIHQRALEMRIGRELDMSTEAETQLQGKAQQPAGSSAPCLQCLMHCLRGSGLLSSCWTAAVLELEEAFAIKQVADAVADGRESASGESKYPLLLRRDHNQAAGAIPNGFISSGEARADPGQGSPLADINKWQALETLCHLRNSLRTCSHTATN